MIEESKHCSNMMKKDFNKEHGKTKKDDDDLEKYTKCVISDNFWLWWC